MALALTESAEKVKRYLTAVAKVQNECLVANKVDRSGWRYPSYEAMVLAEGREFLYAPKPKTLRWGTPKACFKNASHLALRYPERYRYVEGWAARHGFPTSHAWCEEIATGHVVDTTWRVMPDENEDDSRAYFGIAVSADYFAERLAERACYGLFYQEPHTMLTHGPEQWGEKPS